MLSRHTLKGPGAPKVCREVAVMGLIARGWSLMVAAREAELVAVLHIFGETGQQFATKMGPCELFPRSIHQHCAESRPGFRRQRGEYG